MAFTSIQVARALKRLGESVKLSRKRRRVTTALMAERLGISRPTLARLESGDAAVGLGVFLSAVYAIDPAKLQGIIDLLGDDPLGQAINDHELPVRVSRRS